MVTIGYKKQTIGYTTKKKFMKTSFIFYESFCDAIESLPDEEQLKLFKAIKNYALYEKEDDMTGVVKGMWSLIKPQIDANNARFLNGRLGGRPKSKPMVMKNGTFKKPMVMKNGTFQKPNVNVNVNVNDTVNVNANANENENNARDKIFLERNFEWFKKQIDEIWIDQLPKEKKDNLHRARENAWIYLSADTNRLRIITPTGCKHLVNNAFNFLKNETNGKTKHNTNSAEVLDRDRKYSENF